MYLDSGGHYLQRGHKADAADILASGGHISDLEEDILKYDFNQYENLDDEFNEAENDTHILQER